MANYDEWVNLFPTEYDYYEGDDYIHAYISKTSEGGSEMGTVDYSLTLERYVEGYGWWGEDGVSQQTFYHYDNLKSHRFGLYGKVGGRYRLSLWFSDQMPNDIIHSSYIQYHA